MSKAAAVLFALSLALTNNVFASHFFVETTPPTIGDVGLKHGPLLANLSSIQRPKLLQSLKELTLEHAITQRDFFNLQLEYIRKKSHNFDFKDNKDVPFIFLLQTNSQNVESFFITEKLNAFIKSVSKGKVYEKDVTDFQIRYMIYRLSTSILQKKLELFCASKAIEQGNEYFSYTEEAYNACEQIELDLIYRSNSRVRYLDSNYRVHSPAFKLHESPFIDELEQEVPKQALLFVKVVYPALDKFLINNPIINIQFTISSLCSLESSQHYIFSCLFNPHWIDIYRASKNAKLESQKPSEKKKIEKRNIGVEILDSIEGPLKPLELDLVTKLKALGSTEEYIASYIRNLYETVLQAHLIASKITSKEIVDKNERLEAVIKKQKEDLQQAKNNLEKTKQVLQKKSNASAESEKLISSRETRIKRLEAKTITLNDEIASLKTKINDLTKQIGEGNLKHENQLAIISSELKKAKNELTKAERKQAKLFEQKQQEVALKEIVAAQLASAQTEIQRLNKSIVDLTAEKGILELANNTLKLKQKETIEQAYTNGVEAAYKRMEAQKRAQSQNKQNTIENDEDVFIPEQFE